MAKAGTGPLRKDAVTGIEIVCSLPVASAIDERAYFTDCAKWAGAYFGGADNVLSVDVHRDEGAPHCHIIILPLVNGRMKGGKLAGGPGKFLAMQKEFHDAVAGPYGLQRAPARMIGTAKQDAAKQVLERLRETGDAAFKSKVWATLRDAIERAPEPFLMALGITPRTKLKKLRTVTQIFISKGKGKASEPMSIDFEKLAVNPVQPMSIDFKNKGRKKGRSLCSVDFAPKTPFVSPLDSPADQTDTLPTTTPLLATRLKATKPQIEDGQRETGWDDHDQPDHQPDDDPTTSDDDPTPAQSDDDEWAGADYRSDNHNDHNQQERTSWD